MAITETLLVPLPLEAMRSLRETVETGEFGSAAEAAGAAVELWLSAKHRAAERDAAIERGIADCEAGRTSTIEEVRSAIRQRYGWSLEG